MAIALQRSIYFLGRPKQSQHARCCLSLSSRTRVHISLFGDGPVVFLLRFDSWGYTCSVLVYLSWLYTVLPFVCGCQPLPTAVDRSLIIDCGGPIYRQEQLCLQGVEKGFWLLPTAIICTVFFCPAANSARAMGSVERKFVENSSEIRRAGRTWLLPKRATQ